MKKFFVLWLVSLLIGCASNGSQVDSNNDPEITPEQERAAELLAARNFRSNYKLSPGDVFSIQVFNEPELSLTGVEMNEGGSIQYIATGDLVVAGLTTAEVEKVITASLKDRYLRDPRVLVTIDEYRPFFLAGQVAKKGSYPYQPGLTVIKAITIAGGFAPRAAEDKIFVQKEAEPNKKIRVSHDTPVEPGDIITVEESFF